MGSRNLVEKLHGLTRPYESSWAYQSLRICISYPSFGVGMGKTWAYEYAWDLPKLKKIHDLYLRPHQYNFLFESLGCSILFPLFFSHFKSKTSGENITVPEIYLYIAWKFWVQENNFIIRPLDLFSLDVRWTKNSVGVAKAYEYAWYYQNYWICMMLTCPSLSNESINTPSPLHMSWFPKTGPSCPLSSVNQIAYKKKKLSSISDSGKLITQPPQPTQCCLSSKIYTFVFIFCCKIKQKTLPKTFPQKRADIGN